MGWLIAGTVVVLLVALLSFAYGYDARQVRGRTRRHVDSGGKLGDAPDMTPPHVGGSGGA